MPILTVVHLLQQHKMLIIECVTSYISIKGYNYTCNVMWNYLIRAALTGMVYVRLLMISLFLKLISFEQEAGKNDKDIIVTSREMQAVWSVHCMQGVGAHQNRSKQHVVFSSCHQKIRHLYLLPLHTVLVKSVDPPFCFDGSTLHTVGIPSVSSMSKSPRMVMHPFKEFPEKLLAALSSLCRPLDGCGSNAG